MVLLYGIRPVFLVLQCLIRLSLSIQLWPSPGALPTTIPAGCRAELSKNITCSPHLVSAQYVADGRALDPRVARQYCTSTCSNSLKVSQVADRKFDQQLIATVFQNKCESSLWEHYVQKSASNTCSSDSPFNDWVQCIRTAPTCKLDLLLLIPWLGPTM